MRAAATAWVAVRRSMNTRLPGEVIGISRALDTRTAVRPRRPVRLIGTSTAAAANATAAELILRGPQPRSARSPPSPEPKLSLEPAQQRCGDFRIESTMLKWVAECARDRRAMRPSGGDRVYADAERPRRSYHSRIASRLRKTGRGRAQECCSLLARALMAGCLATPAKARTTVRRVAAPPQVFLLTGGREVSSAHHRNAQPQRLGKAAGVVLDQLSAGAGTPTSMPAGLKPLGRPSEFRDLEESPRCRRKRSVTPGRSC